MIISANSEPNKNEFNLLLDSTISQLNIHASNSSKKIETLLGRSLEPYVRDIMTEQAVGTAFENTIELIGGQKFPDIVAKKYYGIEVKTTTQNHWKTTGNSVLEGTRVDDVERIFMLFAKLASPIEFRCRPYEEVLSEVVVTHSPRYLIDMNLKQGDTIFDKIKMPYDTLRKKENPIRPIVDYYRSKLKQGQELWWMDNSEVGGTTLQFWSSLELQKKKELVNKGMILFPEIFGMSNDKFSRIAFWLVSVEKIVHPNVRDDFSAGGRDTFVLGKNIYQNVPRIFLKLFKSLPIVIEKLVQTSESELSEYWEIKTTEKKKISDWIEIVSEQSKRAPNVKHLNIKQILIEIMAYK
jgi:hypothetical protein